MSLVGNSSNRCLNKIMTVWQPLISWLCVGLPQFIPHKIIANKRKLWCPTFGSGDSHYTIGDLIKQSPKSPQAGLQPEIRISIMMLLCSLGFHVLTHCSLMMPYDVVEILSSLPWTNHYWFTKAVKFWVIRACDWPLLLCLLIFYSKFPSHQPLPTCTWSTFILKRAYSDTDLIWRLCQF